MKLRLFRSEFLRNLSCVPSVLAGIFLFGILFFILIFTGSKILYKTDAPTKARVLFVYSGENENYVDMALTYLKDMTSSQASLDILNRSDKDEALNELSEGKADAVICFSDDVLQGIMQDKNIPAEVYIRSEDKTSSFFFKEMLSSGVSLLSSAQASEMAAAYILTSKGKESDVQESLMQVDLIDYSYAEKRNDLFKTSVLIPGTETAVDTSDAVTDKLTFIYYLNSGFILFISFLSICFCQALRKDNRAYMDCLKSDGMNIKLYCLFRFCGGAAVFTLITTVLGLILFSVSGIGFHPGNLASILLLSVYSITSCLFLTHITSSVPAAVMIKLFTESIFMFVSGGIVPLAFLPEGIKSLSRILPHRYLLEGMMDMSLGLDLRFSHLFPMIIYTILFYLIFTASVIAKHEGGRR